MGNIVTNAIEDLMRILALEFAAIGRAIWVRAEYVRFEIAGNGDSGDGDYRPCSKLLFQVVVLWVAIG